MTPASALALPTARRRTQMNQIEAGAFTGLACRGVVGADDDWRAEPGNGARAGRDAAESGRPPPPSAPSAAAPLRPAPGNSGFARATAAPACGCTRRGAACRTAIATAGVGTTCNVDAVSACLARGADSGESLRRQRDARVGASHTHTNKPTHSEPDADTKTQHITDTHTHRHTRPHKRTTHRLRPCVALLTRATGTTDRVRSAGSPAERPAPQPPMSASTAGAAPLRRSAPAAARLPLATRSLVR